MADPETNVSYRSRTGSGRVSGTHPLDFSAGVPVCCLLEALSQRGVSLEVTGSQLLYRARERLGASERAVITKRRDEIVDYMNACAAAIRPPLAHTTGPAELSLGQELLWNTCERLNAQDLRNQLRVSVPFDRGSVRALIAAVRAVIGRHETLRYSFARIDGALTVAVHNEQEFRVEVEDLSLVSPCDNNDVVRTRITEFINRSLPINDTWLTRAKIFVTAPSNGMILLLAHHAVCDAGSMRIVGRDLSYQISAIDSGDAHTDLPPPMFRYSDYALWERGWFRGATAVQLGTYWSRWLERIPQISLPGGFMGLVWKPGTRSYYDFELDQDMESRVRMLSVKVRQPASLLLLTLFCMALAEWSGRRKFGVLSVADGRLFPDTLQLSETVGLMSYMDPIEVQVPPDESLEALLRVLSATYASARLLRFPICEVQPGLREHEFHHKIAAKFNYLWMRPSPVSRGTTPYPAPLGSPSSHAGARWRLASRRAVEGPIGVPIAPIHLMMSHSDVRIACRLEFNESAIAVHHQQMLLDRLFSALNTLLYGSLRPDDLLRG
jgi:condensation domain-containing protein